MTFLLAIDPGPVQSAYVMYEARLRQPLAWAKVDNDDLRYVLDDRLADDMAIEMVASYGMSVGATVFATCVETGRFIERWCLDLPSDEHFPRCPPRYVYRKDVKMHLCGSMRAKDANIRQALIDRYGGKEKAIGLKKTPGPLYGLTSDCWSALGVAITATETEPA